MILFWAGWLVLTQPGLPSCWLELDPCEVHVHFGDEHAGKPHSHGYLFDMSKAQTAAGLPVHVIPASLLLALLFSTSIFRGLGEQPLNKLQRFLLPEPHPPRTPLFS